MCQNSSRSSHLAARCNIEKLIEFVKLNRECNSNVACFLQENDSNSTSSEEGSNTDSGCVLSDSIATDAQHLQAHLDTHLPHVQAVYASPARSSVTPKSALKSPRSIVQSQRPKQVVPARLQYALPSQSHAMSSHVGAPLTSGSRGDRFEPCVFAIKNNLTHPVSIFADADSIVCYKATSDVTEDASSTSGSYILTDDVTAAGVAVSSC